MKKASKRTPTAAQVISQIEKLSKDERATLDQWIVDRAWEYCEEFLSTSYGTFPIYNAVTCRDCVEFFWPSDPDSYEGYESRHIQSPGEFAMALRELVRWSEIDFNTLDKLMRQVRALRERGLCGPKDTDAEFLIRRLRLQEPPLSYGNIARRLNDAGITRVDGEKWKTNDVNSFCSRHNIKPST